MELLFIEKLYDVKDGDIKVGSVLLFENTQNDEYVDGKLVPDYIVIMVHSNDIQHITSNKLDKHDIKEYLKNKYTINQLIEL